jgi:hypothetical protein
MENAASLQALAHGLRTAVLVMDGQNPNRGSLHEALLLTEQTLNESLSSQERAALLRVALKHLRDADSSNESALESELLATIRRAMTAVLFDYPWARSGRQPFTPPCRGGSPKLSGH